MVLFNTSNTHEIDTSNHDTTFETEKIVQDSLPFADIEPEIHEDSGYSIHAADTYIIPPHSECVIPATFKDCHLTETIGLIEPNTNLPKRFNVCGASALVSVSPSGLVPFRLVNPTEKPIKIFRHTTLGMFLRQQNVISNIMSLSAEQTPSSHDSTSVTEDDYTYPEQAASLEFDILHAFTADQTSQLHNFLVDNVDIFSQGTHDLGRTSIVKHQIFTDGSPPIRQRPYRTAPTQRENITGHIQSMLEDDIIEPSASPWASPVVLVKKKDVSTRFCVDYRKLNAVTKKDSYPLPHIQESLDLLGQTQYFTTLDLFSGYWQVEMDESSKEFTAFTTYYGLYEFKVLPFGLCNAPSTFQRLMENFCED